jgi:protein-disulfide isomerase
VGAPLGSAPPPEPDESDHVRGAGPAVTLYLDLACPRCAAAWSEVAELPIRLCVRHFPIASKRPRSPALHRAAEAVALHSEDAFWVFWDSLLKDRAHVDDPHLWERARELGLDPERFERERRTDAVAERVQRDFRSGIRAGIVSTPTAFVGGTALPGELAEALRAIAEDGR